MGESTWWAAFRGIKFLQGILIWYFFLPIPSIVSRPIVTCVPSYSTPRLLAGEARTESRCHTNKSHRGMRTGTPVPLSSPRFWAHPLLSTPSFGGNPHRYPPSPPSTPASPCTPNYPQTHSHSPTRLSHKTRLRTHMHSHSRHCSAAQI